MSDAVPPVSVAAIAADEVTGPILPDRKEISAVFVADAAVTPARVTGPIMLLESLLPIVIPPVAAGAVEIRPVAVKPPAMSPGPFGAIVIVAAFVELFVIAPVVTRPFMLELFDVVIEKLDVTVAASEIGPVLIVDAKPEPPPSITTAAAVPVFITRPSDK